MNDCITLALNCIVFKTYLKTTNKKENTKLLYTGKREAG